MKKSFGSEMIRADILRTLETDVLKSEYWIGYIRGLRRAHHGDNFGTEQEHTLWLNSINSTDEMRRHRGLGYADGLKFNG